MAVCRRGRGAQKWFVLGVRKVVDACVRGGRKMQCVYMYMYV